MTSASMYPDLQHISVEREGPIGVVILNRPQQRNAFHDEMKDSLVEAYRRLDEDNSIKVVVLKGAKNSGNAFCAGADLSTKTDTFVAVGPRNLNEHRDGGGQTSLAAFRVRKPTICAINGHAVGIGITMTLSFDVRVVYEGAKIGFVFPKRGIVPEAASSFFLPKLIGHSKALELLMTAKVLPATAPALSQLWSSVHPSPEATVEAAMDIARDIVANNSMTSLALTKALVWRAAATPEDQHLLDSKAMYVAGRSVDCKEGVQSFKEKRAPNFTATVPKDLPTELYPWWSEVDVKAKARL